jgi:primosomal protein N' (replication factor Y)
VRHIRVAVPVPSLDTLTYRLPPELPEPVVGARVLVPLGKRILTGVVTGLAGESADDESIKPIVEVLDTEAFLPADVIALALWVAEYYACGAGEAVSAAMPPRAWIESERHAQITDAGHARLLLERGARREILEQLGGDRPLRVDALVGEGRGNHGAVVALEREGLLTITRPLIGAAAAFRTVRVAHLTAQGHDVAATPDESSNGGGAAAAVKLGARQREAVLVLASAPEGIDSAELARRQISQAMLKRLSELGLVTFTRRRVERDPAEHATAPNGRPAVVELTPEQTVAFERLQRMAQAGTFATALLHGVTGSGKTELYLRLAREVAGSGRGVIVLVPEIALTPAVAGSFRALFGDRVAIQHSGLSDGERHDQWQRIRRGDIDVVVGTRSAVFTPLPRVGLIIVDEEHDSSYKQEESPRYNGRDVAIVRASLERALVVLGSATPSLESYQNAVAGKYDLVALARRVLDRPLAAVRVVNMRNEFADEGPDVIVSRELAAAVDQRLQRQEQVLVLLNRRGYSTAVFCRQCGDSYECPNCSVSLTVHRMRAGWRAPCHYCNYSTDVPRSCRKCAAPYLEHTGFGTEKVEHQLRERFPAARVGRIDRDSVRRKGALTALLSKFASGELDLLVGTQMIAKGHDFPRVTLVGVISADVGLGLADFRAGERTFQLLTQVAGRAGRGERTGEAIVQTLYPEHYSIQLACRQDYPAFFEREHAYRKGMRYPPHVALINIVVRGKTFADAMQAGADVVRRLEGAIGPGGMVTLGPAPAPLGKLRGEHRVQVFIKGTRRAEMRQVVKKVLAEMPELRRKVTVDVDPLNVL